MMQVYKEVYCRYNYIRVEMVKVIKRYPWEVAIREQDKLDFRSNTAILDKQFIP